MCEPLSLFFVAKGPQTSVARSRFEEDVFPGNHKSVWGSYWNNFQWGFACCHQLVKNSVCTGEAGRQLASNAPLIAIQQSFAAKGWILFLYPPLRFNPFASAASSAAAEGDGKKGHKKDKKEKKKEKKEKKKEKKEKKEEEKRKRERTGEVTAQDLEEYKRSKHHKDDPMNQFK